MTEREMRDFERLKTVDDYMNEIQKLAEMSESIENDDVDEILSMLVGGLKKKYKYIIKQSVQYTRPQGLFSRLRDALIERRERKAREQAEMQEQTQREAEVKVSSSQQIQPQLVEVIENEEKKLLEIEEETSQEEDEQNR
mgnify:FL=1